MAALFNACWPSAHLLRNFWNNHEGDLSDIEDDWIADRVEDIWVARSIAYASTMTGSGSIGTDVFSDSRGDFGYRFNTPGSTPREPDVSAIDWVVYWWCMGAFEDFQRDWNRLLDWTKSLYRNASS